MNPGDIPQPAMIGEGPEVDTYEGEVVATKKNGVEVTVEFKFTYPRGEGLTALAVIDGFGERAGGNEFIQHLLRTGDASLIAAAARLRDTDDEDEFEDYLDDDEEN